MTDDDVLNEFRAAEALLTGHFLLSSGRHSGHYLQCARALMDPERADRLARALAQNPSEILLDEPTNHLDIHHQMQLMQLISELPVTSIVAIHDLNHAAMFCDSLIVMQQGQILASGTPEEILSEALLWDVFRVKTKIEISPYHGKKHIHFIV